MRAVAFYLPQYHPVPENDDWWGKGFTEWRNVTKCTPQFPGHYQPHLPADLGFYDLRLPEIRDAQAALARQYGIHGFCYYHYWFNGRRILERPFNEVLASGKPDFPFCLCWANENWTRVWDGGEKHILLGQDYNHEDDRRHIRSLFTAFEDPRYIRIDGRPLFLVYRTELLPDPARTAEIWRQECRGAGIGEIYLARVENFVRGVDPAAIGFDAAVEFAPDTSSGSASAFPSALSQTLAKAGMLPPILRHERVISYPSVARAMAARPAAPFTRLRCVTPMWDNTARRGERASVYAGSTPALYEQWLQQVVAKTLQERAGDERIVFINAWNEWAEGCHLEPDQRWGHQYLQATARALSSVAGKPAVADAPAPVSVAGAPSASPSASGLRQAYWHLREHVGEWRSLYQQARFRLGQRLVDGVDRP